MILEQDEDDVVVTLRGETRRVRHCKIIKLSNTMYNKPGEQYTDVEMDAFGFERLRGTE